MSSPKRFQYVHIGGESGLRLADRREVEFLKENVRKLLCRIDVEFSPRVFVNVGNEVTNLSLQVF